MRIAFDSNILIYAVDNQAGERHTIAADLLRRAAERDTVLSIQVLGEFFNVVTRKVGLSRRAAADHVADWKAVFAIAAPVPETLEHAIDAAIQHNLQFWDALLWATVDAAACSILLTEDLQDGRRLGRVQFVNPFDPANRRLVDTILPAV